MTSPPGSTTASPSSPAVLDCRLSNELRVLAYDLPGQDLVAAHIVLGPTVHDEPVDGIAAVTAAVLAGRTGDGRAVGRAAAASGEPMWRTKPGTCAYGRARLITQVPATHLRTAVEVLTAAVTTPVTAEESTPVLAAAVKHAAETADALPARVHHALFSGRRLGRLPGGTVQALERLTGDHIAACHATRIVPATATLVIAGDLRPAFNLGAGAAAPGMDSLLSLVKPLETWEPAADAKTPTASAPDAQAAAAPPHEDAPGSAPPQPYLVRRPGALRTLLALAHPLGSDIRHSDWPALQLACQALDTVAGPVSRRDAQHRIRATLTMPAAGTGLFAATATATATGDADGARVVTTVLEQMRAHITDPPHNRFDDAGLERVRAEWLFQMHALYGTAAGLADAVAYVVAHDMPPQLITAHVTAAGELTPAQIIEAFHTHLDPTRLTLVAIGDPKAIDSLAEASRP